MPPVSVIMAVYNGEKWLAAAIDSMLAQTLANFEFIIVDDGSQDRSADIVKSYQDRDARIRFIKLEHNVGKAAAWNHAIDASTGDYIARIDSDDVSLPERLQKQVDYMRSNPEIGALGTFALVVDEELNPIFDYKVPQHHAFIALNIFLGWCVLDPSVMMRRDLLTACGGYDPTLVRGAGIEILARTIWRTRYANLPEVLYLYRKHDAHLKSVPHFKRLEAELMRRMLYYVWGEAPQASLERFAQIRRGDKLSWRERRLVRKDIQRLIESMLAENWVEPEDRDHLQYHMNRYLERTSPRLWQIYCHWRRHRFNTSSRVFGHDYWN